MKMKMLWICAFVNLVLMVSFSSPAKAASCPNDEKDGVKAQACIVGTDMQILAHNSNNYRVTFSVRVTYRINGGSMVTKNFSYEYGPDGGGQIAMLHAPTSQDRFEDENIEVVRVQQAQ